MADVDQQCVKHGDLYSAGTPDLAVRLQAWPAIVTARAGHLSPSLSWTCCWTCRPGSTSSLTPDQDRTLELATRRPPFAAVGSAAPSELPTAAIALARLAATSSSSRMWSSVNPGAVAE